uniref:RNA helicase n=1 Tax=Oncorhynchus kisutch TaxID=8019 RepID=A0A8C7DJX4_ONCKI
MDLFVPDQVLKALSNLGFGSPTAIQALALPPAIRDHMDIVGAVETGSGKTLSFVDENEGATDGQTDLLAYSTRQPPSQLMSIWRA